MGHAIRLTNPTGRNTRAHVVTIGAREFFFSYETCIGFRDYSQSGLSVRLANHWGPTTGRHFRELGCDGFAVVEPDECERLPGRACAQRLARQPRPAPRPAGEGPAGGAGAVDGAAAAGAGESAPVG